MEKEEELEEGEKEDREKEEYLVKEKSQLSFRLSNPLAQTVSSLPHEESHRLPSF